MRKRILTVILLVAFATGCAKTARVARPLRNKALPGKIEEPSPSLTVGERLTFLAAWKGIPVGTATTTVEKVMRFKEYEVYKIVVAAKTNDFLSKFFKVEDTFISYMDKEKLISRHYEAIQREGNYKKDLVIDYDFEKRVATYKNLRDNTEKTCPIQKDVQDPVSAAYLFRTMPVKVGDKVKVIVNLNQKDYEIFADIEKRASVTLPEIGELEAFVIKPYVKLKGKRQRRASVWGYISADKKRLGLYMMVRVLELPWVGEVTATLRRVEYISPAED